MGHLTSLSNQIKTSSCITLMCSKGTREGIQRMTSTQPLCCFASNLRMQKMMRTEKKGTNYSLTAGWPETNLIIFIVKKAQRKPAAFLLPPQSNREAFSFRNYFKSDNSNRFTVTEKDRHKHHYCSRDRTSKPFSNFPSPLTPLQPPLLSQHFRETGMKREAQKRQATRLFNSPLTQHEPPSNEREKLCFVKVSYLKRQPAR